MMVEPHHELRGRLRDGQTLLGTFLSLGSAAATEACAAAGLDWLLADLEHGVGGEIELVGQVHAARALGVPLLARTRDSSDVAIGRALDLGAAGVMLPRLEDEAAAAAALASFCYPPRGSRGAAVSIPAAAYGFAAAAEDTLALVQIETTGALEAVERIAALPTADVLFIGPRDLAHALGCPPDLAAPEFARAAERVVAAAEAASRAAGILVADPEGARAAATAGFRFIGIGSDAIFLARAARGAAIALE